MNKLRMKAITGKMKFYFNLEQMDNRPFPTRDELAARMRAGTIVIKNPRLLTYVPPYTKEPEEIKGKVGSYAHYVNASKRLIIESEFSDIGLDDGDLLGDIETALTAGHALIHSCDQYDMPESCHACALVFRIRAVRQRKVEPSTEEAA